MDDQQKSRLILIAVAGTLLLGGIGWWMTTQNNAADKADKQATKSVTPAGQTTAANPANPATPGAAPSTASTATPANPAAAPGAGTNGLTGLSGMMPDGATTPTPGAAPTPTAAAGANQLIASAPTTTTTTTKTTVVTKYPATKRPEAISAARQVAGREDPTVATFEKAQYPSPWSKAGAAGLGHKEGDSQTASADDTTKVPPPPPKTEKEPPAPPPPPSTGGGPASASAPEIPIDNLPAPPDKPMVTPSLKLTAILGNKAILSVPMQLRTQNKWPAVICLGAGERFEDPTNGSFSVVSVDQDSVTIEEEQERSVKSLPQIK